MKGIIFTEFNQLVEDTWGLETWEKLLDDVNPPSGGAYTSGDTYPDAELFSLVGAPSKTVKTPVPDLVRAFGAYLTPRLVKRYPVFVKNKTPKQFLQSVHDVIHVEVKKLYPEAVLPTFTYENPGKDRLVMIYRSQRKLCALAEGLIEGTAKHFGVAIDLEHPRCLHKGDDHCRLELHFGGSRGHCA